MEVDSSSQLASLRGHIQAVSDLRDRLQATRQIPLQFLRLPTNNLSPQHQVLHDFQQLKAFKEMLSTDPVQAALRSAQDSEKADKTGLQPTGQRQNLKRRRSPLPESPKPYLPPPKDNDSLFPLNEEKPLRPEDLPEYIRGFNRSHESKLHIWARSRSLQVSRPVIVRFTVPDVLVVFLTLGQDHDSLALVIETVTAFGPREKKAPHAYSDYAAYQDLSQQLAHMVRSHPRVSLQSFTVKFSDKTPSP